MLEGDINKIKQMCLQIGLDINSNIPISEIFKQWKEQQHEYQRVTKPSNAVSDGNNSRRNTKNGKPRSPIINQRPSGFHDLTIQTLPSHARWSMAQRNINHRSFRS